MANSFFISIWASFANASSRSSDGGLYLFRKSQPALATITEVFPLPRCRDNQVVVLVDDDRFSLFVRKRMCFDPVEKLPRAEQLVRNKGFVGRDSVSVRVPRKSRILSNARISAVSDNWSGQCDEN